MIGTTPRHIIRKRVHSRIREKVTGHGTRPRLNVYRSLNHIYAQLIDDAAGVTLASASTLGKAAGENKSDNVKSETGNAANGSAENGKSANGKSDGAKRTGGNVAAAKAVGKLIAERAQEKGIKKVVFDRGGYLYHGRVKALADAAREAGLEF